MKYILDGRENTRDLHIYGAFVNRRRLANKQYFWLDFLSIKVSRCSRVALNHIDCVKRHYISLRKISHFAHDVLLSVLRFQQLPKMKALPPRLQTHSVANTNVVESLKNRHVFINKVDLRSLYEHKIPLVGTIAFFVPNEFKRRDTKTADLIDRRRGTLMNCRIDRPK